MWSWKTSLFIATRDRADCEAIRSALKEITVPLIGSTITPIVVFIPLIATTGVTGVFFRALAITVGVSLFTSLALALSWTPTLSQYFIGERKDETTGDAASSDAQSKLKQPLTTMFQTAEHERGRSPAGRRRRFASVAFSATIIDFYERWLRFALERPTWIAIFGGVLIVASFFCYRALGTDLLPEMDEGGFILDYIMPPGTSLAETNRVVGHVEQMIHEIPEVEGYSRRTGLQLGLAAVTEANTGDIAVKLKVERDRGVDEVISELRAQIKKQEPALDVEFVQVLQDMIGDLSNAPEPIQIKTVLERSAGHLASGRPRWRMPSPRFPVLSTSLTALTTPSAIQRRFFRSIPPSPRAPASLPRKLPSTLRLSSKASRLQRLSSPTILPTRFASATRRPIAVRWRR